MKPARIGFCTRAQSKQQPMNDLFMESLFQANSPTWILGRLDLKLSEH